MRIYELPLIFDPELEEEDVEEKIETIKTILNDHDGKIRDVDKWGTRDLAYPINNRKEGYYTITEFESDTGVLEELENKLKLDDEIMRYRVFRIDKQLKKIEKLKEEGL